MKRTWKEFKEHFLTLELNDAETHIRDAHIQSDLLDEICRRLVNRAMESEIYSYTALVRDLNFGTPDKPYYIYHDTWGDGHSRALIGAYLFYADKRFLEEADALIGMIVVSQGGFTPSHRVRSWLYNLGAFSPNTDREWERFTIDQMKRVHQWAKTKRGVADVL